MRGSSGARLVETAESVIKRDTEVTGTRVRDQGIWLCQHEESTLLPAVNFVYHDGYEMEKIVIPDLPKTWHDVRGLCADVLLELDQLWFAEFTGRVPDLAVIDEYDHRSYVTELLRDVGLRQLRRQLHGFADRINWHCLEVGHTHGDGIIDNLGYRSGDKEFRRERQPMLLERQLVLLDPIPACPALPDVVALDVGRVIQSAAGYEAARYVGVGQTQLFTVPLIERVEYVLNTWMGPGDFDLNEARAALHFSVIHMLRGLRTAQRGHHAGAVGIKGLVNDLVEVAAKWMR